MNLLAIAPGSLRILEFCLFEGFFFALFQVVNVRRSLGLGADSG